MEEEMLMAEETPEAAQAEMSEEECAEFLEALYEADESPEETDDEQAAEEGEPQEAAEDAPQQERILVGATGMTAEEIEQVLDHVQSSPERSVVKKFAEQCGMTSDEFLTRADDLFAESKVSSRMQQLLAQDYEPGMARHIAQLEVENARYKNTTEEINKAEHKNIEEKIRKNVQEFSAMYPDVFDIPPEVYEDVAKTGATPVVAYQRYLIAERDRELNRLRQEHKNRERTPGSVRGRGVEVEDPFLVELMK